MNSEIHSDLKRLNIQGIINSVFDTLNVDKELIKSPSRKRYIVDARRIAVVIAIDKIQSTGICGVKCGWTYVGRILNRDHSSIWSLYQSSVGFMNTDKELMRKYSLCEHLRGSVLHRDEFHVES